MNKTVIIHNCTANNDLTDDNGWECIEVAVALNHETWEVVGADVSETALTNRMIAEGYTVLHEDDEFIYRNRWVRKTQPEEVRRD